jgi:hypothetical protein
MFEVSHATAAADDDWNHRRAEEEDNGYAFDNLSPDSGGVQPIHQTDPEEGVA